MTLVSLDVTENRLPRTGGLELLNGAKTRAARYRQGIIPFCMDFYCPPLGERTGAVHSALTLDLVANPDPILVTEYSPIRIEPITGLSGSVTAPDRRGRKSSANRDWMTAPESRLIRNIYRPVFVECFPFSMGTRGKKRRTASPFESEE